MEGRNMASNKVNWFFPTSALGRFILIGVVVVAFSASYYSSELNHKERVRQIERQSSPFDRYYLDDQRQIASLKSNHNSAVDGFLSAAIWLAIASACRFMYLATRPKTFVVPQSKTGVHAPRVEIFTPESTTEEMQIPASVIDAVSVEVDAGPAPPEMSSQALDDGSRQAQPEIAGMARIELLLSEILAELRSLNAVRAEKRDKSQG